LPEPQIACGSAGLAEAKPETGVRRNLHPGFFVSSMQLDEKSLTSCCNRRRH